jgi:hypothetical protein
MMRSLALILFASVATGCQVCGAVEPVQGLNVQMTVENGPLPPGDYSIVIDADGLELSFTETLAAGDVITGANGSQVADGDKHLYVNGIVGGHSGYVQVGYVEGGGPAALMITVKQGSTVIGSQAYAPSYTVDYINGDSCPPPEIHAMGTLSVTGS